MAANVCQVQRYVMVYKRIAIIKGHRYVRDLVKTQNWIAQLVTDFTPGA